MPGAQHRRFDLGMNQDEGSQLLPEGAVYSASNYLFDKIGIARKRGGITGVGATTTYNGDNLGVLVADDGTAAFYSRGKGGNVLNYVNTTTGAFTNMGGSSFGDLILNGPGRPFQHYGTLIYPVYSSSSAAPSAPWAVAGATGAVAPRAFTTTATVAVTAGDKQIVCAAADDPTTLMQVGQFVYIAGATTVYVGKVTRLVSTTAFEVYPTPSYTQAAGTNTVVIAYLSMGPLLASAATSFYRLGAKVGVSYQGRVVLANTALYTGATARLELYPRRVHFSSTLLEGSTASTPVFHGMPWLTQDGYPTLNYFDIPVQEAITALCPTGFGDLLIFSAFRTFRMTGNLTTQFGTEQSITWSPREIPNSVGCMSERSLQRTPRGVIFAHDSGVYTTDGTSMQPLMYKKIQNLWKGLVRGSSFAIYGSALIYGNHYYICGTSGGALWSLMVNLDTLAWSQFTGKTSAPASWMINSAVQDPSNASRVWGLKWWDQSGSGPSMTGGQLLKLDDAFNPTSANRSDSDGTVVASDLITKVYTEDSPGIQKVWKDVTVSYNNAGGTDVRFSVGFVLDSADMVAASTGFTNLDRQDVYTITAATNAAPIVITCGTHNVTVDSWVKVAGVTGNTAANGPWRVQAVTGTTITLMGSIGNGAYVSGGTVRVVDQKDISLLASARAALATGQNYDAVAYRILDTVGSDSLELLAITHTWEQRDMPSE